MSYSITMQLSGEIGIINGEQLDEPCENDEEITCDTIELSFTYKRWTESHAYGDTYANEELWDTDDYEFRWNSEIVGYETLVSIFGNKIIDEAIDYIIQKEVDGI